MSHFGNRAGAGRIHSERPNYETGYGVPVMLLGPDAGVAKEQAQDVALARRQRGVIRQHHSGGAIPCDHIPGGGFYQRGTHFKRVEQALQTGRNPCESLVAHLGWTPEPEQEEMFALDVGQHQRGSDPIQHVGRGSTTPSLLQPRVPRRTDVGALCDLLATQSRRAATSHRETQGRRIEPGAAILQVVSEWIVRGGGHADPVGDYTRIISLL